MRKNVSLYIKETKLVAFSQHTFNVMHAHQLRAELDCKRHQLFSKHLYEFLHHGGQHVGVNLVRQVQEF